MSPEALTQYSIAVLNGLALARLLFLLAAGLSLIFGMMNFINLAHGSFHYFLGFSEFEDFRLAVQRFLGVSRSSFRSSASFHLVNQRTDEMLARVGPFGRGKRAARLLSHREQRQLEIALALLTNPRPLLMDEPSEGLAPLLVLEIGKIIAELTREKLSILLVEQSFQLALDTADRVYVMNKGRIVFEGTAAVLAADEQTQRQYLGVLRTPASHLLQSVR